MGRSEVMRMRSPRLKGRARDFLCELDRKARDRVDGVLCEEIERASFDELLGPMNYSHYWDIIGASIGYTGEHK